MIRWTDEEFGRAEQLVRQRNGVAIGLDEFEREHGRRMPERTFREWRQKRRGVNDPREFGDSNQKDVSGLRPDLLVTDRGANWTANPQRILVCPDIHLPYEHSVAWDTFLDVGREWRPDVLVLLGDAVDFYCVSQHPKDPARRMTFQDEVRLSNEGLDKLSDLRIPRVVYCEGNHETRLTRYIANQARELHGVVSAQELLHVQQRGWEWVPYGHHIAIGKLHFTHDIGFAGMYAARQSVMAFGGSIIFGHTHRAATHYESTVSGERHVGHTMGWLGNPDCIDYRHRARVARESQHGFGIAYVRDDGLHWSHFVPIIDGLACVEGRFYGEKKAA